MAIHGDFYIYEGATASFFYKLQERGCRTGYDDAAMIVDFLPMSREVVFPSHIGGIEVTSIDLHGDSVWNGVEALSFPNLSSLSLSNQSFPDLQRVSVEEGRFYSDGRMIYSGDRKKLCFSLAGREDEVIHVPAFVKKVEQTAFLDSRCRDIVFDDPKVKIDVRTFRGSAFISSHKALFLGGRLLYLGEDVPVLEIPDEVRRIEKDAFGYYTPDTLRCSYLPSLASQEGEVGIRRFELTSTTVSLSVQVLKRDYRYLESIVVPEDHVRYETVDGVLFDRLKKELLFYPPRREGKTYRVPEGTVAVGPGAFFENKKLVELRFPDSVKDIGGSAICNCAWLRRLRLPEGLEGLGGGISFDGSSAVAGGCYRLEDITLPRSLRYLAANAIYTRNSSLETVALPDGLEYLSYHALPELDPGKRMVFLPSSLLAVCPGSLSGCRVVSAREGTARGLVQAILDDLEGASTDPVTVIVRGESEEEKCLFFMPKDISPEGRKYLAMAWDSGEIDYDAYYSAFRYVNAAREKLLMALLLVVDGGIKGEALSYLGENMVKALTLTIRERKSRYFDRLLPLASLGRKEIENLQKICPAGESHYRDALCEKGKTL